MSNEPVNQEPPKPPTQEEVDKAIARAQKLLTRAKTGAGATEAEADTALKLVQELMAKYNFDLAQVEASGSLLDPKPNERVKETFGGKAMYKWQRQLAKYVAEANFCYYLLRDKYEPSHYTLKGKPLTSEEYSALGDANQDKCKFVDGKYVKTHIFVGRKGNVITAQLMYQYLCQTIEDLVPISNNAERLSNAAMSWKEGCGDRLCERLAARRQDLMKAHDDRVKAEQEAHREMMAKAAAEKAARTPKGLPAHHESEVKAQYEGAASDAYDATGDIPEAEDMEHPEADEEAWQPEGDEVVEPEAGTALVLASVYDESEREANYELAHGLEPGSLAKRRAEAAEREKQWAAEAATRQEERVEAPVKQETERQRLARERREREEAAKRRRRWAREDAATARREERESQRRNWTAYSAGARKGEDIGLDGQLKSGKDTKKLGS